MKRYNFFCSYDGGGPADAEESADGDYVLYSEAAAELESLRREAAGWKENFDALQHALVGKTGASGITVAAELRRDAARYRWLATEHAVMLLKRFPSPGPYHEATEVIDASIDAAMTGETR